MQNITSPNDEQWGGGASQSNSMSRQERKRWDPYRKKVGRVWHQDFLRKAPKGLRNMTGRVNFESGLQGQTHQLHPQSPSNGQSPPRPLLAPASQLVQRIGPLPPDHPLKVEMGELKETRKRRQYYWVGLIEDLGEDEWENLATYDRQRWEEENRLADQRFEELAGQIKLAEMGIIEDSARADVPHSLSGGEEYNKPGSGNKKTKTRKAQRLRALERRCGHDTNPRVPSIQRTGRQHFKVSKAQHTRRPPDYPRGSILWTEDKKREAVQHWMHEIGMNRNPLGEAHEHSSGLEMMVDTDERTSDSPLQIPEQDELAIDNTGNRTVHNSSTAFEAVELNAEPLWTAEEEAIFEEAEAAREATRMRLAQLMTVQNERCGLIEPPETARLARDEHSSNPPTKDIAAVPRNIGTVGSATNVADPMAELQGRNSRAVMANQAERATLLGDGEILMDALLVQLGTSQLSLRELALAATRDVEEPPLSTIMAGQGNQSAVTAPADLIALAHSTTGDVQKPARPINVAQEGDQSGVVHEKDLAELGLAESQILADFEHSLVGTPSEEQPDGCGVDDLRDLALAAAQGVVGSEKPYVVRTTREQTNAFTLEDLRALALAVTEEIDETEQSLRGERPAEQAAALTALDTQTTVFSATNCSGVSGSLGTRGSDEMKGELTNGDLVSTVHLADKDQTGAEMIAEESKRGFQIRPVAADFMDIDMVAVETVDMRDVPGSDSEIRGPLAGNSHGMKGINDHSKPMKTPRGLEVPSTNDGPHTLYVGILPKDVTKAQLKELFSGFDIESIDFPNDPRSNHAFITLATASEAESAISTLSGVNFKGTSICVWRGNYHQSQNRSTSPKASTKKNHQSPQHKKRHQHTAATHLRNRGLATGKEQHTLQPSSSAAARLRAARGPFDRYSRTQRDGMAETTQVDRVGERLPKDAFAAPAPAASAVSKASTTESNPVRIRSLLNSGDQLPDWKERPT